ncbi:ATP-binding protein [Streptomyces glomeratus]|uniref:Histidine kinase/HSP90-like ATPase domain-containing protein n=1 Tax=Streptomyces glomeratus TaxID=284452 RepID=A0ABP6LG33_9ACTN|nr:ATP-binding protein [Streptomyces glomeratus]MCF1508772.1 ATP-binding protein [Streptomyces glomeratus]
MTAVQLDTAPCEGVEYVFHLPYAPRAVSAVRRRVRAVLTTLQLPADAAENVLLVASELLTNALVHALPPATLRLSRVLVDGDAAVRVEVTDKGPARPSGIPGRPVDPDEHGRGLGIVTTLSARCGVHLHPDGTCRWAEVPAG